MSAKKTKKVVKKNVVLKFTSAEEAKAFLTYWYENGNDIWRDVKYEYLEDEDAEVVEADLA